MSRSVKDVDVRSAWVHACRNHATSDLRIVQDQNSVADGRLALHTKDVSFDYFCLTCARFRRVFLASCRTEDGSARIVRDALCDLILVTSDMVMALNIHTYHPRTHSFTNGNNSAIRTLSLP